MMVMIRIIRRWSYRQPRQVPAGSRTGKTGMWSSRGGPGTTDDDDQDSDADDVVDPLEQGWG